MSPQHYVARTAAFNSVCRGIAAAIRWDHYRLSSFIPEKDGEMTVREKEEEPIVLNINKIRILRGRSDLR